MVGVLGNGSYLFTGVTGEAQPYYSVGMEHGNQESLIFPASRVSKVVISHTGKFLGIAEWHERSVDAKISETIWIKQLKPDKNIRVFEVHAPQTRNVELIGWLEIGARKGDETFHSLHSNIQNIIDLSK